MLGTITGPSFNQGCSEALPCLMELLGLPSSVQVDRGKKYLAAFADYLKLLEAPWKQGRVEKAGGLWKEVFKKAVHEMQLVGLDDVILVTTIVTQCRNSFPRSSGYAPNQWGLAGPR